MSAVTQERKVLLEIADLKVHFEIKDGKQWFWQPPKTLKAPYSWVYSCCERCGF